jgi:hypothetical protein
METSHFTQTTNPIEYCSWETTKGVKGILLKPFRKQHTMYDVHEAKVWLNRNFALYALVLDTPPFYKVKWMGDKEIKRPDRFTLRYESAKSGYLSFPRSCSWSEITFDNKKVIIDGNTRTLRIETEKGNVSIPFDLIFTTLEYYKAKFIKP